MNKDFKSYTVTCDDLTVVAQAAVNAHLRALTEANTSPWGLTAEQYEDGLSSAVARRAGYFEVTVKIRGQ